MQSEICNELYFNIVSGKSHILQGWDGSEPKFIRRLQIICCSLADISESGRIAYCSMRDCIRKVRRLSMENTVPSGRGEFKPVETPPAAVEAGSPWIYSWEEVTRLCVSGLFPRMQLALIRNCHKGTLQFINSTDEL